MYTYLTIINFAFIFNFFYSEYTNLYAFHCSFGIVYFPLSPINLFVCWFNGFYLTTCYNSHYSLLILFCYVAHNWSCLLYLLSKKAHKISFFNLSKICLYEFSCLRDIIDGTFFLMVPVTFKIQSIVSLFSLNEEFCSKARMHSRYLD